MKPFKAIQRGWCFFHFPVRALILLMQLMVVFLTGAASYREIETVVRNEDFAQIRSMISADGGVDSDTGYLCLMVAALWNKQAVAEKLLALGVLPNTSPKYSREAGETPLTYAVFGAYENIVEFLLKRGADPNYRGDCLV